MKVRKKKKAVYHLVWSDGTTLDGRMKLKEPSVGLTKSEMDTIFKTSPSNHFIKLKRIK